MTANKGPVMSLDLGNLRLALTKLPNETNPRRPDPEVNAITDPLAESREFKGKHE